MARRRKTDGDVTTTVTVDGENAELGSPESEMLIERVVRQAAHATTVELSARDLRLVRQALTHYADALEKLAKKADQLDQLAAKADLQHGLEYITLSLRPRFDEQVSLALETAGP